MLVQIGVLAYETSRQCTVSFLSMSQSLSTRELASRWLLRSVCARSSEQLGYRGEFLLMGHSEVTDTDILLDEAAVRLDAMMDSSLYALPDRDSIVENYVREMFPVYTHEVLSEIIDHVSKPHAPKFTTMRAAGEDDVGTQGEVPVAVISMKRRPSKPKIFNVPTPSPRRSAGTRSSGSPAAPASPGFTPMANKRLIDRQGNSFYTDESGKITSRGGRFTGSPFKSLIGSKEYVITETRPKGVVMAEMACDYKIFMANTLPDAKLSVWPGVPQFDNMDPLITIKAPTSIPAIRVICHSAHSSEMTYPSLRQDPKRPGVWEFQEPLNPRDFSSILLFFRNPHPRDLLREDNVPLLVEEMMVQVVYSVEMLVIQA